MDAIASIKELIPDYAKDVRLSLSSVLSRPALPENVAFGAALAAAFAARNATLVGLLRQDQRLGEADAAAARTAASNMGMTNAWYSFLELAGDEELRIQDPGLRMTAYSTFGGVGKRSFETYALAASIVGRCRNCIASHAAELRQDGAPVGELREIGRIAAIINSAAQILAAEGKG